MYDILNKRFPKDSIVKCDICNFLIIATIKHTCTIDNSYIYVQNIDCFYVHYNNELCRIIVEHFFGM